ncbi:dethiobiotin synthase [Rickettsiales bacterium]|nr:dethiobiotin synthase [Rickettsiales bacterium]
MDKNKGFFISGTDTNVGKTIVSAAMVNKLDACYWKPIQCGFDESGFSDSDKVHNLLSLKKNRIFSEKFFFKQPISPNLAAEKNNVVVSLDSFKCNLSKIKKPLIVEGAGGVLVPINNQHFVADIIRLIGLPLVLVARTSLGTINHTLLTIESLARRKQKVYGIIFVGKKNDRVLNTIHDFSKKIDKQIKILGRIPIYNIINLSNIKKASRLIKI